MSENYSNEKIKRCTDALCNTFFNTGYFSEEEAEKYIKEAKERVNEYKNGEVLDLMELALVISNNANSFQRDSGIVNAVLGKTIATTLGTELDFVERDEKKQITLYEELMGKYKGNKDKTPRFDETFGKEGYRKLFTGNYEGFMHDFMNYMMASTEIVDESKLQAAKLETAKTIVDFESALQESVYNGAYSAEAAKLLDSVCYRAAKGRKKVESSPVMQSAEEIPIVEPFTQKDALEKVRDEIQKRLTVDAVTKSGPKL